MENKASKPIFVTSLTIEYADSSSRYATIYGNGRNQVPVKVTASLANSNGPVEGFDVEKLSQLVKFHHKKDDSVINSGPASDTLKALNCSVVNLNYNHANYGETAPIQVPESVNGDYGNYYFTLYLSSAMENASYQIYATLSIDNGPVFKTDRDKCLNIMTLPALSWCKPELWTLSEGPGAIAEDLHYSNVQQLLDPVSLKPVGGTLKHGNIWLAGQTFYLKYTGNLTLPKTLLRDNPLPKKSEYYDIKDNSAICAMSAYKKNISGIVTVNALSLWYVLNKPEVPELKGDVQFMVGVSPHGQTINVKDIYMETLTISDKGTINIPGINGIILYRIDLTHENTDFFAVSAPNSIAERDIILNLIDDFGNHGSITVNIHNSPTPMLSFNDKLIHLP